MKARGKPTVESLKRGRRRWRAAFLLLAMLGLVAAADSIVKMLPYWKRWRLDSAITSIDIGIPQEALYLQADIIYDGDPPDDVSFSVMNRHVATGVEYFPDESRMSAWCELDAAEAAPGVIRLSFKAGSSRNFQYDFWTNPPYAFDRAEARAYLGPDGHRWLSVESDYGHVRDGGQARIIISAGAGGYSHTLYLLDTGMPAAIAVDIDALSEALGIRRAETDRLLVDISVDGQDRSGAPQALSKRLEVLLKDAAAYDPDADASYDTALTEKYLDARVPGWRGEEN